MNVRLLLAFLIVAGGAPSVFAQTFQPLSGYEQLRQPNDRPPAPKADCGEFDLSGVTLVRPGQSISLSATPDLSGVVGDTSFVCTGCGILSGGTVSLEEDSLTFTASSGIVETLDTVSVVACGSDNNCGEPHTVVFLTQREGQSTTLPGRTALPGEEILLSVPDDAFSSRAVCRDLSFCEGNDYPGRDHDAYFPYGQHDGNDVVYRAAQFGGEDAVCVSLCTAYGLCDEYRLPVTILRETLALPFFDDFSGGSKRPDELLWQDIDVLVNQTLAQDPPSIGVATFDAVAHNGQPYTNTPSGRTTVFRDYLTSAPLNTAGQSGAALSFFLQPRGFGNRPEFRDSFLVQFLASSGEWQTVLAVPGFSTALPSTYELPFLPYTLPLADEFLYDGFTFRFANKNNEEGAVDMWHLDYVKLTQDGEGITTADLALTKAPEALLSPMTSLPLRHYQAADVDLINQSLEVEVFNVNDEVMKLDENKQSVIQVRNQDRELLALEDLSAANTFNLPVSFAPSDVTSRTLSDSWGGLDAIRNYLDDRAIGEGRTVLNTSYRLNTIGESLVLDGVYQNNFSASTTVLDEYMAYDDGTAEGTFEIQPRTVLTQQYPAYVSDSLRGVRIRIPRGLNNLANQVLRLVVYRGDDTPEERLYTEDFPIIYAETVFGDSLQGYTTYLFDQPVALEAGKFFVGWEQVASRPLIGVGYDRNNDARPYLFYDQGNNGQWQTLEGAVSGALMIQPLLGGFDDYQTSVEQPRQADPLVEVYPNPTEGLVHLRPHGVTAASPINYRLFTAAGALLQQGPLGVQLDLSARPPGLYLLEVTTGKQTARHKIVRH